MLAWLLSGPRRWYVPLFVLALSPLLARRCTSAPAAPSALLGGPGALVAQEAAAACRQTCAAANESCFARCEPSHWQVCQHTCLATTLACEETCARSAGHAGADAPFFRYALGQPPPWWEVLDAFEARAGGPNQCKVEQADRFEVRFERSASQQVGVWVFSRQPGRQDQEICLENALSQERFSGHAGAFVIVASWQPRHTAWGVLYGDAMLSGERARDERTRRAAQLAADAYWQRLARQEAAQREALTRASQLLERGRAGATEEDDDQRMEADEPQAGPRSREQWDPRGLLDEFGRSRDNPLRPEPPRGRPLPNW